MNKSTSQLIRDIRKETGLNQEQFAKTLGISKILLALIETDQRNPSALFMEKLSSQMGVHVSTLLPFSALYEIDEKNQLSSIEKKLLNWSKDMRDYMLTKGVYKIKQNYNEISKHNPMV